MCVKREASTFQDNLNRLPLKDWQYAFLFHSVFFSEIFIISIVKV
jgi:hypothetical protein